MPSPTRAAQGAPLLRVVGATKRYGGVHALRGVDLAVAAGSVHGLVGENGAGKSTLGRIVSGGDQPDTGAVLVDGAEVSLRSPRDALALGVVRISQEISVLPERSVVENVFLGTTPRIARAVPDTRAMRARYAALVEATGFTLAPQRRVGTMSLAEQQQVEILRAVARDARLVVMDEPSAALDGEETARLLAVITDLAAAGRSVLLVSHFLDDVLAVCDTVTIMRDGEVVRAGPAAKESTASLVTGMLGADADVAYPRAPLPPPDAPVALAVEDLRPAGAASPTSFAVRAGEVLGICGLAGSGRSELLRAIFGADRAEGSITVAGRPVRVRRPSDAIGAGIAMVPESRKLQGLHLERSLRWNVVLPGLGAVSRAGVVRRGAERRRGQEMVGHLDVRAADDQVAAATLSGGNQQRLLFAKWLSTSPAVLLVDEPTRGVDVGGKRSIYDLIADLAAKGTAVVMVSSELDEVVGLCHRVLVVRDGAPVAELTGGEVTREALLGAAFGQAAASLEHPVDHPADHRAVRGSAA